MRDCQKNLGIGEGFDSLLEHMHYLKLYFFSIRDEIGGLLRCSYTIDMGLVRTVPGGRPVGWTGGCCVPACDRAACMAASAPIGAPVMSAGPYLHAWSMC